MNVYAKFCCTPLRIKKGLGIFRELKQQQQQEQQLEWPAFRVQKWYDPEENSLMPGF